MNRHTTTPRKSPLHVIFPMAGMGSRFDYQFKPFLTIANSTFIEAAVEPFRKWAHRIKTLRFVTLESQDREHDVSSRLSGMFHGLPTQTVCLPRPTSGPAETILASLEVAPLQGQVIICDCDHQLDVSPLMHMVDTCVEADCVIPTWTITCDEVKSWSIALSPDDRRVRWIAEKQWPTEEQRGRGVIGCYFFRDVERLHRLIGDNRIRAISQAIQRLIDSGGVVYEQQIHSARFFGDPERLRLATVTPEVNDGIAVSL